MSARYRLTFELPGLPAMANENRRRQHWAVRAGEAKRWRRAVALACSPKRPAAPLTRARLTLTRCSSVAPDADGCVSGFKHVIDGLVDAGVIASDRMDVIGMPVFLWEKANRGKGHVRVEVEEIATGSASDTPGSNEQRGISGARGTPAMKGRKSA